MKKEDRNTAIIVVLVLIVCTISLIAIGSSLWNLIAPGVANVLNFVGLNVRLANVDYNFPVSPGPVITQIPPETSSSAPAVATSSSPADSTASSSTSSAEPETRIIPANYSYNFPVPPLPDEIPGDTSNLVGFRDSILTDAQLAGYGSGTDTPQTNLVINIPKIGVNSPVIQGLSGDDLLDRGFWVYPTSRPIGQGEMILLCHRRYFGPYDPRTCWNLDKVSAGDGIFMIGTGGSKLTYRVVGVNVFGGGDPGVYTVSETENYLKIVTCHPLYSDANRLVVLAKLEE